MGYRFRYEGLLSYRQYLKEKAEIELSIAKHQLGQCRGLLEDYKDSLRQAHQDLGFSLKGAVSSHTLKNHTLYIAALKNRIEEQVHEIARWEKDVKGKLEILIEKTKQYKVIERLKEKDFKTWNQQVHLMEQKEMSEIAVLRHGRELL